MSYASAFLQRPHRGKGHLDDGEASTSGGGMPGPSVLGTGAGGFLGTAERVASARTSQPTSHVKVVSLSSSSSAMPPSASSPTTNLGSGGLGHVMVSAGGCRITATSVAGLFSDSRSGLTGVGSRHFARHDGDSGQSGGVKGASHIASLLSDSAIDDVLYKLGGSSSFLNTGTAAGRAVTLDTLTDGSVDAAMCRQALLGHGDSHSSSTGTSSLTLSTGLVASLDVVPLPTGNTALGVVGTTRGTLCAFLVRQHQGVSLVKLCESELSALVASSANARVTAAETHAAAAVAAMISPEDTVKDVCISMDPAGRAEMVACATATCAVVIDALDLQVTDRIDDNGINAENCEEGERDGGGRRGYRQLSAGTGLPTIQRERSAPLCVTFANAEVARVLVPQRLRAAFAVDVAAVVLLSDGTLHYVERVVKGGSVGLLVDYHRNRLAQQQASSFANTAMSTAAIGNSDALSLLANPYAIPHVVYGYRLASRTFNLARLTEGEAAYHDLNVTINDAALFYNAKVGRMDLVVAGVKQVFLPPPSSFYYGEGKETAMGAVSTAAAPTASQAWWATARGVVLSQATLQSLTRREEAHGNIGAGVSPSLHTIHVQSGTGLLYRAGVSGGGNATAMPGAAGSLAGLPVATAAGSPLHPTGSPVVVSGGTAAAGAAVAATAVPVNAIAGVTVLQKQNDWIAVFTAGRDLFALSLMASFEAPSSLDEEGEAQHQATGGSCHLAPSSATEMMGGNVLAAPRHVLGADVTIEAVASLSECRVGSASAALMCVAMGSALSVVGL